MTYKLGVYKGGNIVKFAKNLLILRKKKNFSQEDLAFSIGVSRQTIYSWESGLNYPNILMLKKLAKVLDASTDDLINGYDIFKLPKKIENFYAKYLGKYDGVVKYKEVPNWFIPLEEGSEVNWGIYENHNKQYSYHLTVMNKVVLHGKEGYEVSIEEYDPSLNKSDSFSLILNEDKDEIYFLGKVYYVDNIKHIETFRDKNFLEKWGIDNKFKGQSILYKNAGKYELTINSKQYKAIKIVYFEPSRDNSSKKTYFEVFLNEKFESICWQRYAQDKPSSVEITIDGLKYGLEYQCITDRIE